MHRIDAPEASSYFTERCSWDKGWGVGGPGRGKQGMVSWPWKALGVRGREWGWMG